MNILVAIKQVPDAGDTRFDPDTRRLIREGVPNIINPYDRRAISEAVRLREERGGEVIALTMGPPQAREALAEAIVMGADRAIHIEDRRMAGSDTLATAIVLAAAARKIGFDIVYCGEHSIDSETGQLPFEVAELLGIACAGSARKIEYGASSVRVHCETNDGMSVLELTMPCVISAGERLIKPIKVKDTNFGEVPAAKIARWGLEDLGLGDHEVGSSGSPTRVAEIRQEEIVRKPEVMTPVDSKAAANKLMDVIHSQATKPQPQVVASSGGGMHRPFWVLVEFGQDGPRDVSLEMLATCAHLAESGGTVHAVALGMPLTSEHMQMLAGCGADSIYHAGSRFEHPDEMVALLCGRIAEEKPFAVLFSATSSGRALAGRVAAQMRLGLTGDCIGLQINQQGNLVQLKPAYGGNVTTPILSRTFPQMATIRPGALPAFSPRTPGPVAVTPWSLDRDVPHRFEVLSREIDAGAEAAHLDSADLVVCIGAGLGEANVPLARQLAARLGGSIAATRRVVDAGWVPRQFQVGLTGKFIAPRVYVGLGVSGRANHRIGIQKAHTLIAINQDPNAEIFKHCDLGIVADCVEVVRALLS